MMFRSDNARMTNGGNEMLIQIDVSDEVEATRAPWWMIIDPSQNFRTDNQGLHNIASMITGPFFSRAEAQRVLDRRRYFFGKGARVFCDSGYQSVQYDEALHCQKPTN